MTFDDRAKEAADKYTGTRFPVVEPPWVSIQEDCKMAFLAGASFGREEGFREAVEMLRNVVYPVDGRPPPPVRMADWLEQKFKERG